MTSQRPARVELFLPLDRNPDELRIAQRPELGYAELHPRGAEFLEDHVRQMVGERFDEAEMLGGQFRADAFYDHGIIDGVGDLVRVRGLGVGQADVDVELHGLARAAFTAVNADAGFEAQLANENGVHGGWPDYRPRNPLKLSAAILCE